MDLSDFPPHRIHALAIVLAGTTLGYAWQTWQRVRGTTLVSPWLWSLAAISVLELDAWLSALAKFPAGYEELHYLARLFALCPVISLLGAKKPQDGPWNFVVLALWVTLAVPAAVSYVSRGGEFHLPLAWMIVIATLILLTFVNLYPAHLLTAVVATSGLLLLFGEFLLPAAWQPRTFWPHVGSLLLLLCGSLWALQSFQYREDENELPLNTLWLEFRQRFGTFWALRVQERMNDAARRFDWPVELGWSGWKPREGHLPEPLSDDTERKIATVLRGLLRRFVSSSWIHEQLVTRDQNTSG